MKITTVYKHENWPQYEIQELECPKFYHHTKNKPFIFVQEKKTASGAFVMFSVFLNTLYQRN